MQFNEFLDIYGARFKPLYEADGLTEWRNKVKPAHVDPAVMRTALDELAATYRTGSDGPRVQTVMEAYSRAEARSRIGFVPDHVCQTCGNSGWSMGLKTAAGYWINPAYPEHVGEALYHTPIPCYCDLGRMATITDKMPGGLPSARRDAMRRYCIIPLGSVQDAADHRCLSWLRELQGECEQEVSP